MAVLDEPVKLFRIDGKAVREVGAREKDAAHVGKECVRICPLLAIARNLLCLEPSNAAPCARELAERNAEEEIRTKEANHGEVGLVDASLEEPVFRRTNVGVGSDPAAEHYCD